MIDDLPSLAAQRVARRGWKKANRRVDVILTADVPGLGERDEIARVRPGRARNHLVPERLATYVSEEKVARARERLLAREGAREATEGEGEAEAQSAREEAAREKVRETRRRDAKDGKDSWGFMDDATMLNRGDDWNFLRTRVSEDSSLGSGVYTTFPLAV